MLTRNGFTLIELSIVMIVIGLIAGGILVGRDLIRVAEIRATVTQFEQFNTAVNTFKTKYNCLPGDCASAASWDLTPNDPSGVYAGNGDGIIGLSNNGPCLYYTGAGSCGNYMARLTEYNTFWAQLSHAGLIPNHIVDYPTLLSLPWAEQLYTGGRSTPDVPIKPSYTPPGTGAIHPPGWAIHADVLFHTTAGGGGVPAHSLMLGRFNASNMEMSFFAGYAPSDIEGIDRKMDDGFPLSGKARAFWQNSTFPSGGIFNFQYLFTNGKGPPGSDNCVTNEPQSRYNIRSSGTSDFGSCRLGIKASF